jgi:hypothetical protein
MGYGGTSCPNIVRQLEVRRRDDCSRCRLPQALLPLLGRSLLGAQQARRATHFLAPESHALHLSKSECIGGPSWSQCSVLFLTLLALL